MREFCLREGPAVFEVLMGFVRVWRLDPLRFEVPRGVVMAADMLLERAVCDQRDREVAGSVQQHRIARNCSNSTQRFRRDAAMHRRR